MKIISNFRDYYDNLSRRFCDDTIVYLRKRKEIRVQCPELKGVGFERRSFRYKPLPGKKSFLQLCVISELIGFCGEFFPVIKLEIEERNGHVVLSSVLQMFHSTKSLEAFIDQHYPEYFDNQRSAFRENCIRSWNQFCCFKGNAFLQKQFANLNVPVFKVSPVEVAERQDDCDPDKPDFWFEYNPSLKDYNFEKLKDPATAFQQLSTFISSFLRAPEKPMKDVSDEDKLHKHGFTKWSFRKMR